MIVPKDKALHFGAGVIAGLVGYIASRMLHPPGVPFVAVALAVLAGIAKEGFDYWRNLQAAKAGIQTPPHDVDLWDAVSTGLGGLVVALVVSIAER